LLGSAHGLLTRCIAQQRVARSGAGNKCDLESQRAIPVEKGKELASSLQMPFVETSAVRVACPSPSLVVHRVGGGSSHVARNKQQKSVIRVDEAFLTLIKNIRDQVQ
jgi:hypothetical protein